MPSKSTVTNRRHPAGRRRPREKDCPVHDMSDRQGRRARWRCRCHRTRSDRSPRRGRGPFPNASPSRVIRARTSGSSRSGSRASPTAWILSGGCRSHSAMIPAVHDDPAGGLHVEPEAVFVPGTRTCRTSRASTTAAQATSRRGMNTPPGARKRFRASTIEGI